MIDVYFNNIHIVISEHISNAKTTIKICVAWFTDVDLYNVLLIAQKQGVIVNVIIANHELNTTSKIDFKELLKNNGNVSYIGNIEKEIQDKLMHNKFCIVDNEIVITGSYNWTYKARKNDENILVIKDKEIAKRFDTKFESIKPKYGLAVTNNEVHLFSIDEIMSLWDKKESSPSIIEISRGKLEDIFSKF